MSAIRLRYQTLEVGDQDVHLRTLRDTQQYEDDDGEAEALGISSAMWPLFGIVWESGVALAELMLDYDVAGKRVLEVGCGIGVASMVLNGRQADITATDQHPRAESFLDYNARLNAGPKIPFVRSNWADGSHEGLGTFDLIIGSDLLYDQVHAGELAHFIDGCSRPTCETIIIDPRRGYASRFRKEMAKHGYAHEKRALSDSTDEGYRGVVHGFTREG